MSESKETRLRRLRALCAGAENQRTETGIPGVAMVKGEIPEHSLAMVYEPMVNIILQGSKTLYIDNHRFNYDSNVCFVMSVDMPATGKVYPDITGAPYMAVSMRLRPRVLVELLNESRAGAWNQFDTLREGPAFVVAESTPALLDAFTRLLELMNHPHEIPVLAPLYEKEILYRLLQGPAAKVLLAIAIPQGAAGRIQAAVNYIKAEYKKPLTVDQLAAVAAMSTSSFHRHFKALTSHSPLQYVKRVRLLHARAALIATGCSVISAALDVGYESTTQFTREYTREFGMSPARERKIFGLG